MLAILQFDAAALPLIETMLADGRLPALASLRGRGHWLPIDGEATFLQSSTYPTLALGIDVREHGIYSAIPWSPAEQRARFMLDIPRPKSIAERLTERGRRALIVDPYLAFAPRQMAGVYLSGLQFEDRMVMQRLSVPSNHQRELERRHGPPPKLDDVYGAKQSDHLIHWRDQMIAAPGRVADQVIDLLSSNSFEMMWINFAVSHKAGHHLWDPAAVVEHALDAQTERGIRDGLARVYQSIDAAMGRMIEALPEGSDVIVFSPTGMGPNTSRGDFLPDMLDRVLSNGSAQKTQRQSRSSVWSIRSKIPAKWRSAVARVLPDRFVADLTTRLYARADWSKTKAIAVPGENKGYIRLNLKGRERNGIVDSSQANQLIDKIIEGLCTFREPDGSATISKIERMNDLAGGKPYANRLPDLVVYWNDLPANSLPWVESSHFGKIARRGVGSGRTGNHTDDAWAIIAPGRSRLASLGRPGWITDIGATACHLLDADPTGLSGKSLLEVG